MGQFPGDKTRSKACGIHCSWSWFGSHRIATETAALPFRPIL